MSSVAGSPAYRVIPTDRYRRSYRDFLKEHYKKDPKGAAEFEKLAGDIAAGLAVDPRRHPSHPEVWPAGSTQPGWDCRKLEFPSPRLRGAAGEGRLIYLVNTEEKIIVFVWIYTHKQFTGRPPEKSLREVAEGLAFVLAEEVGTGHESEAGENE